MRAADTNVVVRLIARDDAKQVAAAEKFVSKGAWVSLLVLQETLWVLERAYGLGPGDQARVVELLLDHESLVLDATSVVSEALDEFRKSNGIGFSDCLILASARANGHVPLGTFDRKLSKVSGVEMVI